MFFPRFFMICLCLIQTTAFSPNKLTKGFYLGAKFIHLSSQPIATLHLRALICVNWICHTQLGNSLFSDFKMSRTISHKVGSLHVHIFCLHFRWSLMRPVCAINFLKDQSSDKLNNFPLKTQTLRPDTRNFRGSDQVSRVKDWGLKGLSTYFWTVLYITYNPSFSVIHVLCKQMKDHCSNVLNVSSWEKQAWKKFRLERESNPWPLWKPV